MSNMIGLQMARNSYDASENWTLSLLSFTIFHKHPNYKTEAIKHMNDTKAARVLASQKIQIIMIKSNYKNNLPNL